MEEKRMEEKMDEKRMEEKMDKLIQVVQDGRKSFPSFSVTILSYSSSFLIMVLFQPLICDSKYLSWTSSLRLVASILMVILVIMTGMFELVSNRSHGEDLIVGSMIGSLISFFLVNFHLKLFRNGLVLLVGESDLNHIQCHPSPIITLNNGKKWNQESGSQWLECPQFSPTSSSSKTLFQDQILSIPRVRIWRESLRRGWNGSRRCTVKQRPQSVGTVSSNCS